MKEQFKTPILFLVFNRLDTTKKVFEEIKKQKPKQLFIAADGPRNKEEKKKTDSVREYILDNINWKCEVKTLFRKENFGSRKSAISSLNWFFENVEQGIFLEDDDLPSQSFFRFCEELLEKYKDNKKVMSISGNNFLDEDLIKDSYYFSKFSLTWGFATWRRAWKLWRPFFDKESTDLKKIYPSLFERIYAKKKMSSVFSKKGGGWDIAWSFTHAFNNKFSIIPKKNLVQNIGFGKDATHTNNPLDKLYNCIGSEEISFPLKHPQKIVRNKNMDFRYLFFDVKRFVSKKFYELKNQFFSRNP